MRDDLDSLAYFETMLSDRGSGVDVPAAVILETVQAEGGINVASTKWLKRLSELCKRHGILMIVDDIQVGCGRTGRFFSFEEAGLTPDLVCLSKSLSGYGLPFAITLIRPDLDLWSPGEHNGTFRGHNPAFVTATAALTFWESDNIVRETERKAALVQKALRGIQRTLSEDAALIKGRGLIQGIEFAEARHARAICARAFELGMILETAGPEDNVVKLMPSLTISDQALEEGLDILAESVRHVLRDETRDTGLVRLDARTRKALSVAPGENR
jgi:diaminobutyrate-2-oxoglutarate transaminase